MWPFKRKTMIWTLRIPYVHPQDLASALLDNYGANVKTPRKGWWIFKEKDAAYRTRLAPLLEARWRAPTFVTVPEGAKDINPRNPQIGYEDHLKQLVIATVNDSQDSHHPNLDKHATTFEEAVAINEKRRRGAVGARPEQATPKAI